MKERHPGRPLPNTYDRGRLCLDMIAISESLNPDAVSAAGFLPFYHMFFTDHRGGFVDIHIDKLFDTLYDDTTRPVFKRFTTGSISRCDKYLNRLEHLLEQSNIFHHVDHLEVEFLKHLEDPTGGPPLKPLIERCCTLFVRVTEFMLSAEKFCGSHIYSDSSSYSLALKEAAGRLYHLKKRIRLHSTGHLDLDPVASEQLQNDYTIEAESFRKKKGTPFNCDRTI